MKIFLDMDNVIVDLIRSAALLFGEDYDALIAKWPLGVYDMEIALGISRSKFFSTIKKAGVDFWSNLPAFPHTMELYEFCCSLAPTYVLTMPTMEPESLAGKLYWLHDKFGHGFNNYVMTPHKGLCADKTSVLIDDKVSNVENFIACGGRGIIWPTFSNSRHAERFDAFNIVKKELLEITNDVRQLS